MSGFPILGDIFSAFGNMSAANDMKKYIADAQAQQTQQYGIDQGYLAPYQQMGSLNLGRLATNINKGVYNPQFNQVDPSQIANDPGYQFRMQQAQQALERSAAAKGGLNSGAFMKGLDQYSQGLASQEYNNAFNRNLSLYDAQQTAAQNQYGRLANLVNMGYGAASGMAGLGQSYANNMSSLYGAYGNAQAARDMALGQGAANGVNNLASFAMGSGGGGAMGGGLSGLMGGNQYSAIPAQSFYGNNSGGGYGYNYPDVIPAQSME